MKLSRYEDLVSFYSIYSLWFITVKRSYLYLGGLPPQSPSPTIVDSVQLCTIANSFDDFYRYRCFYQLTLKNYYFISNYYFSVLIYSYIVKKHVKTNFLVGWMWWYKFWIEAMVCLMILTTIVGDGDCVDKAPEIRMRKLTVIFFK